MAGCTCLHVRRRCLPRQEQLAEAKAQKLKDCQPALNMHHTTLLGRGRRGW